MKTNLMRGSIRNPNGTALSCPGRRTSPGVTEPTRACLIWCATARWTHGAERDRQLYLTLIHQAKTSEAISYRESQLAEALERAVDALDEMSNECERCSACSDHGNKVDESLDVDVNEILRIHGELKKQVVGLKELHVKFTNAVAESDIDDLVEELASQIEETEQTVDELQTEVLP